MAKAPTEIRSLARSYTVEALRMLARIMRDDDMNGAPRVMAACALLDRGWGKPPQAITGENGESGIEVIIRHIVEDGRERTKTIELKKLEPIPEDRMG